MQLGGFVTLWQNIFIHPCNLFHIVLVPRAEYEAHMIQIPLATKSQRLKDSQSKEHQQAKLRATWWLCDFVAEYFYSSLQFVSYSFGSAGEIQCSYVAPL